jgi:ERF superfamily
MTQELATRQPTGMELLAELSRKVSDPQAAIEIARQVVELQTRTEELRQSRDRFDWEKLDREAKVAFAVAFKAFKDEAPKILKTKNVNFENKAGGQTNYWHVELDKACDLLIPALLKVGITHRWKSTDLPDGRTRVTCFLRHNLGYEEEGAALAGPADQSGGKNPIQGVGSSVSYLERYTFLSTCGIVPAGKDDDGAMAAEDIQLLDAVANAQTQEDLNSAYLSSQAKAMDGKNMTLVGLLTVAAQERRKVLRESANAS